MTKDETIEVLEAVAEKEREYAFSGRSDMSDAIHTSILNMLERLIHEIKDR